MDSLQQKANLIRKWCLIGTTTAASGHPTSCLSAADIGAVLFNNYFTYDIKNPLNTNNDRFILSKGHAAPLLYTLFAMAGGLKIEELKTLRKFGSRLEGHPTPRFPYTDAATGSLGQGLSVGCGTAIYAKRENYSFKTYVLLGDSEVAEGSVWEAANFASYYKLNNLIAIVDVNRLGQSQETMFGHHMEEYANRFSAFGWEVATIDGHDFSQINDAFKKAQAAKKPFAVIAKTLKGKGVSFIEDKEGWHGKPLSKEDLEKALKELGDVDDKLKFKLKQPVQRRVLSDVPLHLPPVKINYKKGEQHATREVYGQVITELGEKNKSVWVLDAEVKNSTYAQNFLKSIPERYVECFIGEQNMIGVSVGLARLSNIPFSSTFATFFTRAFDQIRMAAIGGANVKFVGSHAGVSIGEDGPSQMGLEDFAMFGALPGTIIFHPSDAVSTSKILPLMINHKGISYLRTLRPKTAVLYDDQDEKFEIGGSKILRKAHNDKLTIVACGITVHEALKAYDELKNDGIMVRVVDCYSVKPIDKQTLKQCSNETMKPIIITVEDHFAHGGLGDFVLEALADQKVIVEKMAVTKISRSGLKDELLDDVGISAKHIVNRVRSVAK